MGGIVLGVKDSNRSYEKDFGKRFRLATNRSWHKTYVKACKIEARHKYLSMLKKCFFDQIKGFLNKAS